MGFKQKIPKSDRIIINSVDKLGKPVMVRIDRDEIKRRYAAGERNFAGLKLGGDLDGLDLTGADLSGTSLEEFF